jgi:hypothetical protein
MNNMHYYFKFQTGNEGFAKFFRKGEHHKIPLSIYFGKWKCENYKDYNDNKNIKQVKTFFDINDSNNIHYFWIFYKERIYLYQAIENKLIDGPNDLIDDNGSYPKSIECKLIKDFEKIKLLQVFSNMNANQKYNRKTIVKLEGAEERIAESLINEKPMNINRDDLFNYLSPIEFETLCFLIFNIGKSHCSSFRGGTLENYDLRVRNKGQYEDLADTFWIQVKKKETNIEPEFGIYLIHSGETSIANRKIGKKWIFNTIKNNYELKKWLCGLFTDAVPEISFTKQ